MAIMLLPMPHLLLHQFLVSFGWPHITTHTLMNPQAVAVLLFPDFETLDVFGPVELFGRLADHYRLRFYSQHGGLIQNLHGVAIQTEHLDEVATVGTDIFLIPGGPGTRREVGNEPLLDLIRQTCEQSTYVLTVCTGSALLAQTGLLNGRKATSNKRVFEWVTTQGKDVHWVREARWVVDGKYYTSSGVSAGMDMALGFLRDHHGEAFARKVAFDVEYTWHDNSAHDPFSISTAPLV